MNYWIALEITENSFLFQMNRAIFFLALWNFTAAQFSQFYQRRQFNRPARYPVNAILFLNYEMSCFTMQISRVDFLGNKIKFMRYI